MSIWSTKSFTRERNYIVLKHGLKGINATIAGVKFRNSYAVVEKDSKTYFTLKKMPMLKGAEEFPLLYLRKLSFITRILDVKTVYGQDVFYQYKKLFDAEVKREKETAKKQAEDLHLASTKCKHRTSQGALCSNDAVENSPSGYCSLHILNDTKLEDLGIHVPKTMTKDEKLTVRERIVKKLNKVSSNG